MAPPRKPTSRGNGELESDPERENRTQARAPNPVAEDVERENKTQARAPRPPDEGDDPERANSTQARAPNPLKKVRADPDRVNKKQAKAPDYGGEEEGSYRTGQNYQSPDEEGVPHMSLEGDGLEALDPELGSRTKALPALETESSGGGDEHEQEEADDANATRAGPPLKLEIVAGPDTGKKRKFKGVRMVIGRTPGVDLQLSDQSVSRRHVELIYGDQGVMMKDLGSGNGTKVNGTKVAEKLLEHGDEIAIGKTKIRFVDELAAFKKAREENEKKDTEKKVTAAQKKAAAAEAKAADDAPGGDEPADDEAPAKPEKQGARARPVRTSRRAGGEPGFAEKFKALPKPMRLGIVGLVAAVLFILLFGIVLRPPPPPPVDPAKIIADQKMQDARNAAREGDFEKVVQLVAEAEKLQPGIDKTKLGNQAKEELGFVNALEDAKKAIETRRFEDARKALDKTGKGSLKSEEAKVKVRAELETAEVAYKREKIDELIASGEVEAAKSVLAELPIEMQAEASVKIVDFERQLEEQKAGEAKDSAAAARIAASNRAARREQEINEAFVVVERKFGGAEWDRAASECARVMDAYATDRDIYTRAKKLQAQIPNFGRNYDEGMKKYRQGTKAQAAKPLRSAQQLYVQMNLRANKFGQELEDKIGDAAIIAGKEALLRDDLVTAWQMFKDAARFDPSDPKARAGLDEVASKAEDLFQMAYAIRDREPRDAVRKFKIVVQVTDPGSSTHEKAKNQLAAMAP